MLDLIKDDTATALIWGYQNTDRRFATSTGGANPSVDGDFVGLDLDESKWGGKTFAQVMAGQPELLNTGSPAVLGRAPAPATYNTTTGVGTAARTDGANKSYVSFPGVSSAKSYRWDVENTGSANVTVRIQQGNAVILTVFPGQRRSFFASPLSNAFSIEPINNGDSIDFAVHSFKEIPSRYALQGTANSRPKWQSGPKPYLLFDGADDFEDMAGLIPGASGTMVSAFRCGSDSKIVLAGGDIANKRAQLNLTASGFPEFAFNGTFSSPVSTNHVGLNVALVQTWGGGRRRCYVSTLADPLVLDQAAVANMDGAGGSFKIGSNIGGTAEPHRVLRRPFGLSYAAMAG